MPIAKSTLPFLHALNSAQRRALKALAVGFACVAALALITTAQITVDRMATDIEPGQTQVATQGE